jgi:DNA-binding CsgD family transcriptional regulator
MTITCKNNFGHIANHIRALASIDEVRDFVCNPDIPCVKYAAFSYWHSWSPKREPEWYVSSFPKNIQNIIGRETHFRSYFEAELYFKQIRPLDWTRAVIYFDAYPSLYKNLIHCGLTPAGVTAIIRGPIDGFALFYVHFNFTEDEWAREGICWAGGVQLAGTFLYELVSRLLLKRDIIGLSRREAECMSLASRGLRAKEIAYDLDLSEQSVNLYMARARLKLGAANTTHAVVKAVKMGLVSTS